MRDNDAPYDDWSFMSSYDQQIALQHCPSCGMGICPGPQATPEQRAEAVEYQSREWAQKDIPQEEWETWVREFIAAQIRCALNGKKVDCQHVWVDARNEYVRSGEYCQRCGFMRPGNSTPPAPPSR